MSKLTEVLKLFCYDPETDGANTFNIPKALNENWEKIDQLVLLAVAAAAAYDPEGSYVVGDYCTHGGKLHKCGTPIPDGEPWNAAHWTETSVAAELAGRLSLSGGIMKGAIDWGNNRHISGGGTATDFDFAAGKVAIRLSPENAVGNDISKCVVIRDTGNGKLYPIATATSPEEHAIVPKNGATLIQGYKNSYSKDQFGHVLVNFSLHFDSVPAKNTVIFSLPEMFRPTSSVGGIAVLWYGTAYPAIASTDVNGDVYITHSAESHVGQINLHGTLVFDA